AREAAVDRRARALELGLADVAQRDLVPAHRRDLRDPASHDAAADDRDLHVSSSCRSSYAAVGAASPSDLRPSRISPINARCRSFEPSTIWSTFASRYIRPTRYSEDAPYAPWICTASDAERAATSVAYIFAMLVIARARRPASSSDAHSRTSSRDVSRPTAISVILLCTSWKCAIDLPKASRSRAYAIESARHASTTPTARAATPSRPRSTAVIATRKPSPSAPR